MENDKMRQALGLMTEALKLLDEADASPDIGAHLDLAINVLQDWLFGLSEEASLQRVVSGSA